MRNSTSKKMPGAFISIKAPHVKWDFLIYSTKSWKAVCKQFFFNLLSSLKNLRSFSSRCFQNNFCKNTLKSRLRKSLFRPFFQNFENFSSKLLKKSSKILLEIFQREMNKIFLISQQKNQKFFFQELCPRNKSFMPFHPF